jgi:hypothetical protein
VSHKGRIRARHLSADRSDMRDRVCRRSSHPPLTGAIAGNLRSHAIRGDHRLPVSVGDDLGLDDPSRADYEGGSTDKISPVAI